ncbi:hypothetical protein [Agromyces humi]|uniref:hypothetical protein n=1 Tax=Agromyces humi TaxID=1766800 RepID=UPI0013581A56|nr:hypothetical protein [Agromyces humi]
MLEDDRTDWQSQVGEVRPYTDAYLRQHGIEPGVDQPAQFSGGASTGGDILRGMGCDPDDPYFRSTVTQAFAESFEKLETLASTAPETPQAAASTCPFTSDTTVPSSEKSVAVRPYVEAWVAGNGIDLLADWNQLGTSAWYDTYGRTGPVPLQIVRAIGCPEEPMSTYIVSNAIGAVLTDALIAADVPGSGDPADGVDIPDVDAPDVNPFYCNWSFRGGVNCGIHG